MLGLLLIGRQHMIKAQVWRKLLLMSGHICVYELLDWLSLIEGASVLLLMRVVQLVGGLLVWDAGSTLWSSWCVALELLGFVCAILLNGQVLVLDLRRRRSCHETSSHACDLLVLALHRGRSELLVARALRRLILVHEIIN